MGLLLTGSETSRINGAGSHGQGAENQRLEAVEAWLGRNADAVALVITILGLLTRLRNAVGTWLNADEALHFLIANQPSLATVYQDSLTNAHPPLYYFVLHFWMRLGDSEVSLRLLSVLAGAATVWVVYRWLARFSPAWGLSTALLFATLAPLAALEAEVRGYALVILLMAATLLALERAMADRSPAAMFVSALLLYGAILTHYCTLFFALALGALGLIRSAVTWPGRRFAVVWAATQAGAGALYLFLFVTHVSRIRGGGMDQEAHTGWLRSCYFDAENDSLVRFIVVHTGSVFAYIFGSKVGAVIGVLVFLVGVTLLLIRRGRPRGEAAAERYLSLAALLTFALMVAGALASLFPYGGTRHVAFLAFFVLPLACFPIVRVARGRLGVTLLVTALAAIGFRCLPPLSQTWIPGGSQRRSLMVAAIDALRRKVPKGAPVLVDYQTSMLLGYYLRDGGVGPFPSLNTQPEEVPLGGYRMLVWARWNFDAASFESAVRALAITGAVREGQRVWVVDAGAGPQWTSSARTFGDNIAIFTVDVPTPSSTAKGPGG